MRRVGRYLLPYPWLAAGMMSFAVLSLAGAFAYPHLAKWLIDGVIGDHRPDRLPWAAAGLLGAFLVRDVANSLRIRLNNVLEQNVTLDLRRDLYAKLQRLPAAWFDARASGDLSSRVTDDVNAIERLLIDGVEQGTIAILSIIGAVVVLFASRPSLAWIALAPAPVLAGGALAYTRTAHSRYRGLRRASAALNALLLDNLQGVRQVKVFVREAHEDARFADRAGEVRTSALRVMKVWAWYSPGMNLASGLGTALVMIAGTRQALAGELSLGGLVKFVGCLGLLYDPIGRLHSLNQLLAGARAAAERVFDVMDAPGESGAAAVTTTGRARGELIFEHVSAHYGAGRPALRDVSFRVAPGEVAALVGPTGAGKTTLANLLPRFYEPAGGRILLDGRELRDWPLAELRAQLAVVSQEPFLFNGTIAQNILYGRLSASREEMTAAAVAANCDEFVQRLPDGYDTQVGERGVRLSVGQKQRITIARALLKDAPVLILDEATASVDSATERLIQVALERLMAGRTALVIAHRLSTIRRADRILVLDAGALVEEGDHEHLLARQGLYGRLWAAAQLAGGTFEGENARFSDETGFLFDRGMALG